jgi:phosphoribosylamine--glycine ligase
VAPDRSAAERAVREAMLDRRFGDAGQCVLIEEHLAGAEASFFAVCDGRRAVGLPVAQDHKRAYDGDEGPNTGGMGAFAPSPLMTPELDDRIRREIVEPVLEGMHRAGHPFRGFLYVGLMLTAEGPKVIEFNVRLGDPEAQVVLPMLSGELAPVLDAAARGALDGLACEYRGDPHVGSCWLPAGTPAAMIPACRLPGSTRRRPSMTCSCFMPARRCGTGRW